MLLRQGEVLGFGALAGRGRMLAGSSARASGISFTGGAVSAEGAGTLATLTPPTGYSWPAASQQAELTAGGYDPVTMAIAGTSGTAGALTEVDDLSAAYVALLVGETATARMQANLVRDSDGATVEATVRLVILGATEVTTAFNSSVWATGEIPALSELAAVAAGQTIYYTTTTEMTNTARANSEYTLAAPAAGGTIGRVFGADLTTEIVRVYFEPGILWCDVAGTTYSLDVSSFPAAAYLRAGAVITADGSTLIAVVEDESGTQVTEAFTLTGYTPQIVGKVSLFDGMERVQEDPITAAGIAFRGTFRVEADGTVSTVSVSGGVGFAFLKTSAATEVEALTLLDDLPVASDAPVYSGNLATAAEPLYLGAAESFDITGQFSGGRTPRSFAITALPTGMVDDGDGTASGTPTTAGDATLTAVATDARGVPVSGSETVTVAANATQTLYGATPLILNSTAGTPVLPDFNIADMAEDEEWAISCWWYRRPGAPANKELMRLEIPGQDKHIIIKGQQTRWRNPIHVENATLADAPIEGRWNHIMVYLFCAGTSGYYGVRHRVNGGSYVQDFASRSDMRFIPERFQIATNTSLTEIAFLGGAYSGTQPAAFWNGGAGAYIDDIDLAAVGLTLRDKIEHHRLTSPSPGSWAEMERPEFDADTGDAVYWWDVPTPMDVHAQTGSLAWPSPDPLPTVPLGSTPPLVIADISDALGTVTEGVEATLDLRTLVSGGVPPYSLAMSPGTTAGDGYSWSWTPSASGNVDLTLDVEDAATVTASATDTVTVAEAPGGAITTQTIYSPNALTLTSSGAGVSVLPAFNIANMIAGEANNLAISCWYYLPEGHTNLDAEIFRLEVPGQSKHLIVYGRHARWRDENNGTAENTTLADAPVAGAFNHVMVHLSYGSYSGVLIQVNGGAVRSDYTNAGNLRFTPERLVIAPGITVLDMAFLASPRPNSNAQVFWNGGAGLLTDDVDFGATNMTVLDQIRNYRTSTAHETVDWGTTDKAFSGDAFWWDVPTPPEASAGAGTLAWPTPDPLPVLPSVTSKQISPYVETYYVGETYSIDLEPMFDGTVETVEVATNPGGVPVTCTGKTATFAPTSEATNTTVAFRGRSPYGTTAEKTHHYRVLTPTALALTGVVPHDLNLDTGKWMPSFVLEDCVTGGQKPWTFSKLSGPSWVNCEAPGVPWGKSPDTAQASEQLVYRCTDAAGNFIDLPASTVTVTAFSRADTIMVPTTLTNTSDATDFGGYLRSLGASGLAGKTLLLPAGHNTPWMWEGWIPALPLDGPPCIIRGADKTARIDRVVGRGGQNYIFENLTLGDTGSAKRTDGSWQPAWHEHNGVTPNTMWFDDVVFEGTQTTTIDPDDGQSWQTDETFVHDGNGFGVIQAHKYIIIQGSDISKFRRAVSAWRAEGGGVYETKMHRIKQDGMMIASCYNYVVHGNQITEFEGNYLSAEHQDGIQIDHENEIPLGNLLIQHNIVSGKAEAQRHLQGVFRNQPGARRPYRGVWGGRDTAYGAFPGIIVRDNLIIPSSPNHGLSMCWYSDVVVERNVILIHPDEAGSTTLLRVGEPSSGLVKDTLFDAFSLRDDQYAKDPAMKAVFYDHLFEFQGSIARAAQGPARNVIFPNWDNGALDYEDPREAVAAGQPASAARFWIDPASAWGLANPNVGPPWLRDGVAT